MDSRPMRMLDNRRFFNLTAWGYDFITRQKLWRRQIGKMLSFVDDCRSVVRVLDLGCGPGISTFVLAEQLGEADVVGIDVSDQMIRRARDHHRHRHPHLENIEFRRADVYELPFAEDSFDLAVGHSFLYLLVDRRKALDSIARVLGSTSGRLVLLEPNAEGSLIGAMRDSSSLHWLRSPVAAGRFATSMVLWRLVSRSQGQLRAEQLDRLFASAGFVARSVEPTLAGLGLHATGRIQ